MTLPPLPQPKLVFDLATPWPGWWLLRNTLHDTLKPGQHYAIQAAAPKHSRALYSKSTAASEYCDNEAIGTVILSHACCFTNHIDIHQIL